MTLENLTLKFNQAESNFDNNPNAKTAEKLQIARQQLNKFIADSTPISEEQRNFEKAQLKKLIQLGRAVGLSL
jgi:hypothetical protein